MWRECIVKTGTLYKLIGRLYDDTGFEGSVTFARYDPPREGIDRLDDGTTLITLPVEGQKIASNLVNPRPGSPADAPLIIVVQQEDARDTTASPKIASSINDIAHIYDIRNTGEGLSLGAYTVGALDSFVTFSEYNAPARDIVIQDFEHSPDRI